MDMAGLFIVARDVSIEERAFVEGSIPRITGENGSAGLKRMQKELLMNW